ncbi:hypothetical protein JKF63_00642 [Porcisia hertigi]|uniref:Uncharacterized protein n=1 Tax=Porcisia hertigi TaxID=2761500 RepID=A0A836KYI5_9TRYP|nr:hypothetical protein JKF63_00642 [Porcisia hertigi]
MEPLPHIRSSSISKATPNREYVATAADVHKVLPLSLSYPAPTTAATEEGINRKNLRREAGLRVQHIVCGVAESSTYKEVLVHIEDRFAHTSHAELRPLVQPSQLPSIVRPREPQAMKFLRAAPFFHKSDRERDPGLILPAAALGSGPTYVGADGHRMAAEVGTEASTELPSSSTGFTEAHRWEMLGVADRVFFRHAVEDGQRSADGSAVHSGTARQLELYCHAAPSPLDQLPTFQEKYAYLCELETAGRQCVISYESWDQHVILEMMAVQYVTFVLKPSIDLLRREESEQRDAIVHEQERLSYFMYNESPLALEVQEGKRAMKARELQLNRILQLTPAAPRHRRGPQSPAPADTAARAPLVTVMIPVTPTPSSTATPLQSRAAREGAGLSSSISAREASPTPSLPPSGTSVSSDEARRVLRSYVQRRHGASLNAIGTLAATPQDSRIWSKNIMATFSSPSSNDNTRRTSVLVLPPISSAQAPRRNTIGIADCVALFDETMRHREQLISAEQRSRTAMYQSFDEEMQVVLEWQRRRMHLERLLYWRHQRELVLQEEVEALTTVTPALHQNAKALLKMLEEEEDAARQKMEGEERASFNAVWQAHEELRHVCIIVALQRRCMAALDLRVWRVEAVARRRLVFNEESSLRNYRQRLYLESLSSTLTRASAQLRALSLVSVDPTQRKALRVLQNAFRLSLRGRLGWRYTHEILGREIRDSRNVRKIARGTAVFQSFKAVLSAEEARLSEEQAQQHLRERCALFSSESGYRTALLAQQEFARQVLTRERVLHVEEVYAPLFTGLVEGENEMRLVQEVEEELKREALFATNVALVDIIRRKDATAEEERVCRVSTRHQERASWSQLLSIQLDEREVHRINDETREAEWESARVAFAELAEKRIRHHHECAMMSCIAHLAEAVAELLSTEVMNDPIRRGIERAEATAAIGLLESMATAQCALYASVLTHRRQVELNKVHQQAICVEETESRADILREEATSWAFTELQLFDLFSGPLHDFIVRRSAVKSISVWYRALLDGTIGRAVSRQRLREDLARHREDRQLRSQRIAQRLHMEHVRRQLDTLMMEMRKEQLEAVQRQLDLLVQREEPRGREHIESLQMIIFGVLVSSEESQMTDVRRNISSSEALICWQDSERPEAPMKKWGRTSEEMSEDDFALRIQRAWRRRAARVQCKRMLALREQVAALEVQGRAAVELEELEAAATQLFKPCLSFFYLDTYVRRSLTRACVELAVANVDATQAQEWSDRLALLWDMRYDDCDLCLCEDEARSRRLLEAHFYRPFILQSELKEEEQHQRTMLVQERVFFLLRILVRKECKQRLALGSDEVQQRASLHAQLTAATPVDAQGP